MSQQQHAFSGADHANGYAANAARLVPGLADMHRMATLLLAERVPALAPQIPQARANLEAAFSAVDDLALRLGGATTR